MTTGETKARDMLDDGYEDESDTTGAEEQATIFELQTALTHVKEVIANLKPTDDLGESFKAWMLKTTDSVGAAGNSYLNRAELADD